VDTSTALIAENAAFADLLRDAEFATPVPTCPDWTLGLLLRHVGRGDRWCAQIVAERSADAIDPRTVRGGQPPADSDGQTGWLYEGVRELLEAVEQSGPDTPVWTFLGPRPAAWWIRRRLHETVVHRADAALALGADFEIETAVAADGITEHLERLMALAEEDGPADRDRPLGEGQSLHLHAIDTGPGHTGEWTMLGRPDGIVLDHEHARATTALRGPVRGLLLAVTRRGCAAELGVEIFGDQAIWDTWLARTPF